MITIVRYDIDNVQQREIVAVATDRRNAIRLLEQIADDMLTTHSTTCEDNQPCTCPDDRDDICPHDCEDAGTEYPVGSGPDGDAFPRVLIHETRVVVVEQVGDITDEDVDPETCFTCANWGVGLPVDADPWEHEPCPLHSPTTMRAGGAR